MLLSMIPPGRPNVLCVIDDKRQLAAYAAASRILVAKSMVRELTRSQETREHYHRSLVVKQARYVSNVMVFGVLPWQSQRTDVPSKQEQQHKL